MISMSIMSKYSFRSVAQLLGVSLGLLHCYGSLKKRCVPNLDSKSQMVVLNSRFSAMGSYSDVLYLHEKIPI